MWSGVWRSGCQRLTAGVAQESECRAAPKCHMGLFPSPQAWRLPLLVLCFLQDQQTGYFQGVHVCVISHFSCVWLFPTPWTVAYQAPLSMGFSRQNIAISSSKGSSQTQGSNPCPVSPALQAHSLPTEPTGKLIFKVRDASIKDTHIPSSKWWLRWQWGTELQMEWPWNKAHSDLETGKQPT